MKTKVREVVQRSRIMVIWADPAKSDLRAIHDFIASDSKYYAKKVVQDIMDRTNILEEYPIKK